MAPGLHCVTAVARCPVPPVLICVTAVLHGAATCVEVDWAGTEALLQHGLDSCLRHVERADYPLLLAENQFRTADHKEKVGVYVCE